VPLQVEWRFVSDLRHPALHGLLALGLLAAAFSGAPEDEHWAYVPPVLPVAPPAPPGEAFEGWARNPIDAFVAVRMAAQGLEPSPAADRATLIRRASLDLIGLPPSLAEVDAFLVDDGPRAYERMIDRLLVSPAFGEQQGRLWLDLARYADSDGYEKDERRTMWRYRDWVIDAFNRDLPFDQFTIEQLAGDLLPDATLEQRIATGFHRNTMVNKEGGADPEEWRVAAVKDRVNTTGEVWLGATVKCAECHNHKFDPLSQEDYYRLYAFFDQTEDTGNSNAPLIDAPLPDQLARKSELEAELEELEWQLSTQTPELNAELALWQEAWRPTFSAWTALRPTQTRAREGSRLAVLDDDSVLALGELPDTDVYEVTAIAPPGTIVALRLQVLTDPSLPAGGPGWSTHRNFVLNELVVRAAGVAVPLVSARADYYQQNRPWPAAETIDGDLTNGWAIAGGEGAAHQVIFELAEPLVVTEPTELAFELHQHHGGGHLIGRFRLSVTAAGVPDAQPVPSPTLEATIQSVERTPDEQAELEALFRARAAFLDPLRARARDVRAEMRYPTAMVMRERSEPRTTHLQVRGNFLDPGRVVEAGVPASMGAPGASAAGGPTRLDLARWLVAADNPLTARVTVNRFWQQVFGTGLVRTSNDFGTQGEPPTHPELLDWLAIEFRERGWSVKRLLRTILTSATYRQSSHATRARFASDPGNRWLARGPRLRVDAETVRDIALSVSGLLCNELGGPSVFPPQPEGIWMMTYSGDSWTASVDCDRYRRGLYTFWRRTAPYPTFMLFDATSREVACSRRPLSDTPLQALALLNDPAFVELAGGLARRMLAEGGATPAERAAYGFRLCTTRPPEADEVALLVGLYESELAVGDELTAWTLVANALLNLEETITKG